MQYKQIDGLRFFAVMAVIFHHVFPLPILKELNVGAFGVDLFFVISGFLITEILIREKIKNTPILQVLKIFFLRRIVRIFPLYYLYLLLCFFIVPDQFYQYADSLLTYTINIWMALKGKLTFPYFIHLWSLAIEEQFYILWPFLIIFSPIKSLKFLFPLMMVFAITYRTLNVFYLKDYELFNYVMLPTTLDCFGTGALLAYLKAFHIKSLTKAIQHSYLIVIGIFLYFINNKFGTPLSQQAFGRTLNAFSAFYLVGISSTIFFNTKIKWFLENYYILYLGRISYGMYIYHLIILGSLGQYFTKCWEYLFSISSPTSSLTKMFFEFTFVFICTIAVSILSYELFEKRFLVLKKYFSYSKV